MDTILNTLNLLLALGALIFSAIAAFVGLLSYKYVRKSDKENVKSRIAAKQAELDTIKSTYFGPISAYRGMEGKTQAGIRKATLEADIEQLKKRQERYGYERVERSKTWRCHLT